MTYQRLQLAMIQKEYIQGVPCFASLHELSALPYNVTFNIYCILVFNDMEARQILHVKKLLDALVFIELVSSKLLFLNREIQIISFVRTICALACWWVTS